MDFRKRDRVVEGCNWLMVGVAAGCVAYAFAGTLFSPADSATGLFPSAIVQPASLSTEVPPVPVWGSESNSANPSNPALDRAVKPSRASTTSRSERPPRRPSPPPERNPWGDAPYVVGPEVPIPLLTPLPPGVGPDF